MAFVSAEQVQRERRTNTATCRRCGEEGLIWDKTATGKNWMYDIQLATEQQVEAYAEDRDSVLNARQTQDYGLVIVLKYRPHICPEADGERLEDQDRPNDLDTGDSDEIMGLRVTE